MTEKPPSVTDDEKEEYNHGYIEQVDLEAEMQRSYLDYAMSVIVGRALPEVRDGLKPVHRRVIYGMYDGGFRPTSGFSKCARVVGDVMANYHPHGDAAIYDALVRLAQHWSMRAPLVAGQGNFGSPGNLGAAASRYTECKMAPLAMEMVRDIDEDAVDFIDNYDGRNQEPTVLPSRFPNLLVNGSEGIAVGMATRIPPHNLREVAEGVQWYLENPEATREELLEALIKRVKGPDFPTGATILGYRGIEQAYRTGKGSIVQRAIVNVEEIQGRQCLVVTELPYQVNPDNLASKIAQLVKDGQIQGIADIRDESSERGGQRLVIVLKRDAIPKVVLNNLYKRTQLQDSFPANMLAIVDGVPRTLSLDGFIHYWVRHQVDVIVRRTNFRLRKAEERLHILRGYLKALDALDEVIALIRRSPTVDDARSGLMDLLDVDQVQADAILAMQLRRLAALERQKIITEYDELEAKARGYRELLASEKLQYETISKELKEIVDKYGDERKTTILPYEQEMSMEDLIPEEECVVTITRSGYVKRTTADIYRSQHRGGKGIKGASLREDDIVEHFFVTSSHSYLLFFTNFGKVYRIKCYELPEGSRNSKGQHVANVLAFQPDETIAQVLAIEGFEEEKSLILATARGLVKKTPLVAYGSNRAASGIIAITLREDENGLPDKLVAAALAENEDDLIFITKNGQSLRVSASEDALPSRGRTTQGVRGIRLKEDDELLTMQVVDNSCDLLTVTEGGFAKRTQIGEYRRQNRAGSGVKVANFVDEIGCLAGAVSVNQDDEVMLIMESGNIVRVAVSEVNRTGRVTKGVIFVKLFEGDRVIGVTKYLEIDNGDADETAPSEENTGESVSDESSSEE